MTAKRVKPKSYKVAKPTIWIGQYRFGAKTIYAVTAASTRGECEALIKGGPFFNTVAREWVLTIAHKTKRRKK